MEQVLTKKHIMKKVIFFLVFIILFNFVSPQIVWAGGETGSTNQTAQQIVADSSSAASMGYDAAEWVGGVLWTPIQALFLGLGDTIVTIMQKMVYGLESSFIVISTSSGVGSTILAWIAGIGTAVGLVALQFIPVVGQALTVGILAAGAVGLGVGFAVKHLTKPDTFYLPVFGISPQEIFSNEVPILDVNFFSPNTYTAQDGSGDPVESSAAILQETVAKWYVALRNFALVGLLSVLVYIGIRIIFGSSAADKAKYKERLMDWLVAMFLLFMMHYIMYFAIILTESITEALKENLQDVVVNVGSLDKYKKEGDIAAIIDNNTLDSDNEYGEAGDTLWLTNFMGQARIQLQMINDESSGDTKLMQFGYTVIYFVFIIYTVTFLFQYLKRVVYMAFLTMIAPVVALTYPIDKMNDGKAQAFDMWLKEYIFNLLLQPFHLLLYTVLIGSAMEFATENTIYAIVAIGFLLPAEKLLRRFFGFEKAQTASIADAAVGGAMVMKGLDMVKKIGKTGGGKQQQNNRGKIRTQKNSDAAGVSGMLSNNFERTQGSNNQVAGGDEDDGGGDQGAGRPQLAIANGGNGQDAGADAQARTPNVPNDGAAEGAAPVETPPEVDDGDAGQAAGEGAPLAAGNNGAARNAEEARNDGTPQVEVDGGEGDLPPLPERGTVQNDGQAPSVRRGLRNIAAKYKPTKTSLRRGAIQLAKNTGREAVSLTGRAAGIMAGATAAAIATTAGGGKNAVSTFGAGMIAGNAVGGNLSNTAINYAGTAAAIGGEVAGTFQEGRLGTEAYQDQLQERADQFTIDSPEVRQQYLQEFGPDHFEEALEASKAYRREGITDDRIIMEAMGLDARNFGAELDAEKRVLVAKLASTYKSEKDIQNLTKRLTEAYNISATDAEMIANGVRKINKLV